MNSNDGCSISESRSGEGMSFSAPCIRASFIIFSLCLGFLGLARIASADTELNIPGYRIVWHDEFQGSQVDPAKWRVNEGVNAAYQRQSDGKWVEPHWFGEDFAPWTQFVPINDERQYYSPNNVAVSDGMLRIQAKRETITNPIGWYDASRHLYTSGKINTGTSFRFQFGIVRMRAQLPQGRGLWPALWMLNTPDPWFWDNEIDIMEARGSQPTITTSAHHHKVRDAQGVLQNVYRSADLNTGINLQTSFNEYSVRWEPTFLQTSINDQPVFFDNQAIPQDPMFLIINAAVGGWFDGEPTEQNVFPTNFDVDWVRVWQPASKPSDLASGDFENFQGAQWPNWNSLDSGNISSITHVPSPNSHAVRIDRRPVAPTLPPTSNLLTDRTAGNWQAYLNRFAADDSYLGGEADTLSNIPATSTLDTLVLPIHQNATSPRASAVAYRQVAANAVQGRTMRFSGSVTIDTPFLTDSTATAFIRIFHSASNFTEVMTHVKQGGAFHLETTIPTTGVNFVQIGLETKGVTGSAGRLTASALSFSEASPETPADPSRTGLNQTVVVGPGQALRYGVLAANDASSPLGTGAEGRMTLEYLDGSGNVISQVTTQLVQHNSKSELSPFSMNAVTPANTTAARLRLERITLDEELDLNGSFIVDSAFLHAPASTDLPVFTTPPPATHSVSAGEVATLNMAVTSATSVQFHWYHKGKIVSTERELNLSTHPDSGGTYFAVVSNQAGPVISTSVELTVLNPDSDGDGFSDYQENFLTRTNPSDPKSAMRVQDIARVGDDVELRFDSISNVIYQLSTSSDLVVWLPLGDPITANSSLTTIRRTPLIAGQPRQFFRIEVVPAGNE